jgi:2'-5' RNA ligase
VRDEETKSALLIPVPEVEPYVAAWREQLDPASQRGVPAHVTALFPFVAPASLDAAIVDTLARVLSTVKQFDVAFLSTAWFDDRVLYLAPSPDEGFRNIARLLESAFPQYRPYEGKYAEATPHLTIGDGAPLEELRRAEEGLRASLPIVATAKELWLMVGGMEPHSWTVRDRFEFASNRH